MYIYAIYTVHMCMYIGTAILLIGVINVGQLTPIMIITIRSKVDDDKECRSHPCAQAFFVFLLRDS